MEAPSGLFRSRWQKGAGGGVVRGLEKNGVAALGFPLPFPLLVTAIVFLHYAVPYLGTLSFRDARGPPRTRPATTFRPHGVPQSSHYRALHASDTAVIWERSLRDAKIQIEAWRIDCNEHRPHTSLGNQTPGQPESEWQLSWTAKKGMVKDIP